MEKRFVIESENWSALICLTERTTTTCSVDDINVSENFGTIEEGGLRLLCEAIAAWIANGANKGRVTAGCGDRSKALPDLYYINPRSGLYESELHHDNKVIVSARTMERLMEIVDAFGGKLVPFMGSDQEDEYWESRD